MVSMSNQIIFPDQDWLNQLWTVQFQIDHVIKFRPSNLDLILTLKANIEYSVDSCHLTEYMGHKTVLNHQQIVNKNCIMAPSSNSTFSYFDAKYHR